MGNIIKIIAENIKSKLMSEKNGTKISLFSHSERRRRLVPPVPKLQGEEKPQSEPAALHKTQVFSAWRAGGLDRRELILATFMSEKDIA
jgi:hypothetical protein